ncbi:MAG: M15 family metallopeptidase [archaeon]|nr:MAG: M15 family metallopeptidase [archaeon]
MRLIPDEKLVKIPVKDNKERLINLKKAVPSIQIKLDSVSQRCQKLPKNICYVRESVSKKLIAALKLLPKGYSFRIHDAHRPIKVQEIMYNTKYAKFKKRNPSWNKEKLRKETSKFVSPPNIIPPHSTGGTIDLTILNKKGKPLNMGTRCDVNTTKSFTDSKTISKEARKNRDLLIKVMEKVGFVNYPTEWWHWSYGDRYWAAVKKKKYSIYGAL